MDNNDLKFETIPAVNLFKGMPMIKGKKGYEPVKDSDGEDLKIQNLMDELKERFTKFLVSDLEGINRDRPQLELIKEISTKMELWVDGGSRSADSAIDILVAGAEKVVMGTKTLKDLEELEKAFELSENVILGIDYDNGIVSLKKTIRDMSPLDLAREAKKMGLENIIFTDLKHIAEDSHFEMDTVKMLAGSEMKIYIHGRFNIDTVNLNGLDLTGVMIEIDKLI